MEVSKNSIFLHFEPGLQNIIMIIDKTLEYKKQNSPMSLCLVTYFKTMLS